MNPREGILELVRIGKHEDYFRSIYEDFDDLLASLQRIAQWYKSSADNSLYCKISKNVKQIEKNLKQMKEQNLKFMNESQAVKIIKNIIYIFQMIKNTFKMVEDYIEQSKINENHVNKTASATENTSRKQSIVNVKPNCDGELYEYKKKHKDNEFDNRDESDANKSEDNEYSKDKESVSSDYYDDNNKSYGDNEFEHSKSNGDESDSDYYDSNKDYSVTEDSEESNITGSDSYITPDFNSSGGCDCSNYGENSDCSYCYESSDYDDYDESSEVSYDDDSSIYCSDDCVCPSCRNIGYEEEEESMSESGRDDLYEYETPESYESDIYGENTIEDGENVY
jgi:hypothetical protein